LHHLRERDSSGLIILYFEMTLYRNPNIVFDIATLGVNFTEIQDKPRLLLDSTQVFDVIRLTLLLGIIRISSGLCVEDCVAWP
jgi:hypothetical protein